MFNKLIFLSLFTVVGLLTAPPALADTVAAKKAGVKVYDQASKKGNVLKKLKKGEELDSIKRKGVYWEVKVDGKTGYVSILKVKRKSGANNKISGAIREAVQGDRAGGSNTARARSAVMGVRGLSSSDDTSYISNVRPDFDAVYAMEDMVVQEQEVERIGELVFREIAAKSEDQ